MRGCVCVWCVCGVCEGVCVCVQGYVCLQVCEECVEGMCVYVECVRTLCVSVCSVRICEDLVCESV